MASETHNNTGVERGSALIIVLGAIAVMTLLVLHVTTWSEVMAKETKTHTDLSMFHYAAESATEHALWMHIVDKRDYKSRTVLPAPASQEDERERWMADAKPHALKVDGISVHVAIKDAGGGFNPATTQGIDQMRQALLRNETDLGHIQTVDTFINTLLDYTDRGDGDAARLNGMERPEYKREGLDGLPRNGPIQFREELFWLPPSGDMGQLIQPGMKPDQFLDFFQAETPQTGRIRRPVKPAFFSSSPAMLRYLADLDQDELNEVMASRKAYLNGGERLFDSLDADMAAKLKKDFSFVESGLVRFETKVSDGEGTIQRVYRVTRYAALPSRRSRR